MAVVTVLMPVYNAEKFLGEAIESILSQTFTDFDFLIIDDASTDRSASIIEGYSDPRIRVVRNEVNLGISGTLNKGIELSHTELIARMDADDISHPTRLQKQINYFEQHADCALLSTWTRIITEDKKEVKAEKFKTEYYYYNLNFDCWIYHPTVMYKRSAVLDVGGYSTRYGEDFDLFWKLTRKYPFGNIEEVLLDYRVTSQSLHQVTHKKEYDEAVSEQVARNIRFYTGEDFEINKEDILFFQFNIDPLVKQNVFAIVTALNKFNRVNAAIVAKQDVAKDRQHVIEAIFYRKRFLWSLLRQRLSFPVYAFVRLFAGK